MYKYKLIVENRVIFDDYDDCFELMDAIISVNDDGRSHGCINFTTISDLIDEYNSFIEEEKDDIDGKPNITLNEYYRYETLDTIEMLQAYEENGAKILDYLSSGGDRNLYIIKKDWIDSNFLSSYYDTNDFEVRKTKKINIYSKEDELKIINQIISDINNRFDNYYPLGKEIGDTCSIKDIWNENGRLCYEEEIDGNTTIEWCYDNPDEAEYEEWDNDLTVIFKIQILSDCSFEEISDMNEDELSEIDVKILDISLKKGEDYLY